MFIFIAAFAAWGLGFGMLGIVIAAFFGFLMDLMIIGSPPHYPGDPRGPPYREDYPEEPCGPSYEKRGPSYERE